MPLPELLLIEKIRALASPRSGRHRRSRTGLGAIRHGIGDDCAVLAGSKTDDLLVTTDLCLEGVHFRLDWHSASSVGHLCLVRGLSDIAAMGGRPTAAFLSLGMPAHVPQRWVDGFFQGFVELAERFAVTLAGGDIATSLSGIAADVVVLGRVPKGKAVLRSGARPGDLIYVTGVLGRAAEVLTDLRNRRGRSKSRATGANRYFSQPRLTIGQWLRRQNRATAMIDISDGLSVDMAHICTQSRVSAVLLAEAIPYSRSRQPRPQERSKEDVRRFHFALHGGEDYELLFTVPRSKTIPVMVAGTRITRIGEIVELKRGNAQLSLVHADGRTEPLQKAGWEHFSSSGDKRSNG